MLRRLSALPAALGLQALRKIGHLDDGNPLVCGEREYMARVAGDDVITVRGGGAFQYPVIGWVNLDDVERFGGRHCAGRRRYGVTTEKGKYRALKEL